MSLQFVVFSLKKSTANSGRGGGRYVKNSQFTICNSQTLEKFHYLYAFKRESDLRNDMRSLSEIMTKLPLPLKSVVITVMTLACSHLVVYDLMEVSFFSPMEKASDFRFSDFYTIVAEEYVFLPNADGRGYVAIASDVDFTLDDVKRLLEAGYDPDDEYYLTILGVE